MKTKKTELYNDGSLMIHNNNDFFRDFQTPRFFNYPKVALYLILTQQKHFQRVQQDTNFIHWLINTIKSKT